jgi:crotonobetainyl-CoA:carnitine CoA-transferase CaiB-like acyl-CoA transferase
MTHQSSQPLAGISVVDLTSNVAAPFASAVLADLGASVIHVEGPRGDDCRRMAPTTGSSSAYFEVVNRNKQGEVLDVRVAADYERLMEMLSVADVFVTNLRPGKLDRLGLDGASLRTRFPQLIHASLSAYGPTGAERDKPGYDAVLQARTGIASVTGTPDGPPVRAGVSILDVGAGTWLALGVISALYNRERSGHGGEVATSLFETGVNWVSYHLAAHQVTGQPSERHGSGHPAFSPYGIFRTGDGEICLGIGSDGLFAQLCSVLDRAEWLDDPRFATNEDRSRHAVALRAELESATAGSSADELAALLGKVGLPVDAVHRPEHLLTDPQAAETGILLDIPAIGLTVPGLPLTFNGSRPQIRHAAPAPPSVS